MATIRIADSSPTKDEFPRPQTQDAVSSSISDRLKRVDAHDDIYNIRSRSMAPSLDKGKGRLNRMDNEDDDPGLRKPGDFKQKQVFKGKMLLWLSYQSIGVIYGDIGTSPLYVYSSTFSSPPSRQDLVGALSLIIWSLFMMVTVKYVFIILRADNDGEGGTFSTYSLLSRYMNITNRDPREASLIQMKRHLTGDLERAGQHVRHGLESSKFARTLLKVMGVLAVTMVISDGLLTPAQSVLGAVQGIEAVHPNISKGTVIGVTDAILVVLFVIQPLGITKISFAFAPIIIIWLGFNAVFGIYNLAKYDAGVFEAFNPGFGFEFLIRNGEHGWRMLGGILLAFTGVEALFADLGAFSRRAVQLSWLCYTFPCLLLAYIGQAAYISVHPEAYSNPFFNSAPPGTIYAALVIAILAAIVASQAIITATFQLLAQVMKLSYFPQIKVIHTSNIFHGQLYIPVANWLLMIGTIMVASIYNNTTSLGNAYGVCVMFVTFFDSCMVSLAAMFVWRISPFIVFLPWLIIACLDGTYLSSALTKVPDGAWFTITLAAVLASILLLWRFGKEQQWFAEAEDRFPTSHFVTTGSDGQMRLTDRYDGTSLSTTKGFGIFFDKAGETTPIVFSQFVLKLTAMPEVSVFFHLRPLETPSVAPENRHAVSRLAIPNCYRLVVRYGYNDEIITPNLASVIAEQIRRYLIENQILRRNLSSDLPATIMNENRTNSTDHATTTSPAEKKMVSREGCNSELAKLEDAYAHKVLYVIGKEQMKIKEDANKQKDGSVKDANHRNIHSVKPSRSKEELQWKEDQQRYNVKRRAIGEYSITFHALKGEHRVAQIARPVAIYAPICWSPPSDTSPAGITGSTAGPAVNHTLNFLLQSATTQDLYQWSILTLGKAALFNKQLSKHSTGAYIDLCNGAGVHFKAVLAEGAADYEQEMRLVTTSTAFDAPEQSIEHPSSDTITFQLGAKEWRERFNAEVAIREALEIEMLGIKGDNAELLRKEEATRIQELEKAREVLLTTSRIFQERALKAAEDSQKITHAATSLIDCSMHSDQAAEVVGPE
ncbi:hypothetical protein V502_00991 [Pseudogymnoascus sp. VKM F-4520 (FW-2644)]|nr:hypothetical protein V502_00991 [Pseudogymnoascus sp. VKM F-4520 (FW-2644)]